MVVRHRLTPIGKGEVGVDALSLAKRLGGVGILEAVQQQNTSQEGLLRSWRAGVRELDPSQVRRLRAGQLGQRRRDQGAGQGKRDDAVPHKSLFRLVGVLRRGRPPATSVLMLASSSYGHDGERLLRLGQV